MTDEVHVLCIARYGFQGPSSRYRIFQYVPRLEAEGLRCTVASLFDDAYVERLYGRGERHPGAVARAYWRQVRRLRAVRDADVVLLEKDVFPFVPALLERRLGHRRAPTIVDLDDAVFHQYDQAKGRSTRALLSGKFPRLFREAAAVTAGNRYLADYAAQRGARRVELLPTVVDLDRYPPPPPPERAHGHPFTIGWIGSPITAGYLERVREPLATVCRKTGARVRAIGAPELRLDGVPLDALPWSHEREVEDLRAIDVGIMPLPDAPWERGKCGLKLIQYLACGVPVVASPVGVNPTIVQHGTNGLLANGPDEWTEALVRLHDDAPLRERMGRSGRRLVEASYSLQRTAPRLVQLVREIAGGA